MVGPERAVIIVAALALVLVVGFVLPLAVGLVALPIVAVLTGHQGEGLQMLGWIFLVEVLAFLVMRVDWRSSR